MKKILVVLNGTHIPRHVIDAAMDIAGTTASTLHGVFMSYALELTAYTYPFPNDLSLTGNIITGKAIAEENAALAKSNMQLFEAECQAAKIDCYIEPGTEISLGGLIAQSAFSDCILADANESLGEYHIADLLVDAHCPVYLISEGIKRPENVILTYDGSFSSMFAIKMYTYLFPELRNLPAYLVHVAAEKNRALPREKDLKRWLAGHYGNVQIKILHGDVRDELVNYTSSIPGSLAVMGSFGRSAVSRLFHKSLANTVIEDGKSSLFITHE